jgi:hypothetical protein
MAAAFVVAAAGALALDGPSAAATGPGQKKAAESRFVPDKAKLKILLDGQTVGSEEFEITPSGDAWMAKGVTELRLPDGGNARVNATLQLRSDGSPKSYEWTSQGEKKNGARIAFEGGVAKIQLEMEGARPFLQELMFGTPMVAILDNNLYHHYEILARIYNWNKKGAQAFPVLIPQDLTPGSITAEATGPQSAGQKSYEGLRVTTPDLEVVLYLDANHRLMRLEVPASKVSVIRE